MGTFYYVPFSSLDSIVEVYRRRVIAMLMDRGLLKEDLAERLMSWRPSGFSIDNSDRIFDNQTQESLAQYLASPSLSLKKIRYEPYKSRVLFTPRRMHRRAGNRRFPTNLFLVFQAECEDVRYVGLHSLGSLAEFTQYVPASADRPKGVQLIRRYAACGCYRRSGGSRI